MMISFGNISINTDSVVYVEYREKRAVIHMVGGSVHDVECDAEEWERLHEIILPAPPGYTLLTPVEDGHGGFDLTESPILAFGLNPTQVGAPMRPYMVDWGYASASQQWAIVLTGTWQIVTNDGQLFSERVDYLAALVRAAVKAA